MPRLLVLPLLPVARLRCIGILCAAALTCVLLLLLATRRDTGVGNVGGAVYQFVWDRAHGVEEESGGSDGGGGGGSGSGTGGGGGGSGGGSGGISGGGSGIGSGGSGRSGERATARPFAYVPLDTDFINANFAKLKAGVSRSPIGKFQSKVDSMMTRKQLDIDISRWRFHTPSGTNLSLAELQEATRDKNYLVPNLAHYILPFQDPLLAFHHYVCILSGFWVMKPQKVVFWYVKPPRGHYWNQLMKNMTSAEWEEKVVMVQRPVADMVYNISVKVKEHQADVMRIEAILLLGGAYFDLDVITLNRMEPLRKFPFSIGKELPTVVCNGVFLGTANNTVLAMWHLAYQTLDDSSWGGHSLYLIGDICKTFPGMCHIEEDSLDRPGWIDFGKVFGPGDRSWDWQKKNYAMHLFYRLHGVTYDMNSIRTVNHAFGDMARFVLFGRKDPFKQ